MKTMLGPKNKFWLKNNLGLKKICPTKFELGTFWGLGWMFCGKKYK
jgi:hypothetical protein